MCLDRVTKTGNIKDGVGWKWFGTNLEGEYVTPMVGNHKPIRAGKWINERDYVSDARKKRISCEDKERTYYKRGFHIFKKRKDAQEWYFGEYLKKVGYRKAHTLGLQSPLWSHGYPTVVAEEIKILG